MKTYKVGLIRVLTTEDEELPGDEFGIDIEGDI